MKLFKINYIVGNQLRTTTRYADSKQQVRRHFAYTIIGVYQINEVGAIIG